MNGTILNALTIMIGSLIGTYLRIGFIKDKSHSIISVLGLMVCIIGLQGVINAQEIILLIVSLALGVLIGEGLNLEEKFNGLIKRIERKYIKQADGRFAQGLISGTLLFGVGAMAIVGSIESGMFGNESILYTKSTLDFITSLVLASSFGWGVFFSFIPITLYQGFLTILSSWISVYLTDGIIQNISALGSVLIIVLGLNMMKLTQFKVINLLPSLLIIVIFSLAQALI